MSRFQLRCINTYVINASILVSLRSESSLSNEASKEYDQTFVAIDISKILHITRMYENDIYSTPFTFLWKDKDIQKRKESTYESLFETNNMNCEVICFKLDFILKIFCYYSKVKYVR